MAFNLLIVDYELIIRQGIEFMIDWEKKDFIWRAKPKTVLEHWR